MVRRRLVLLLGYLATLGRMTRLMLCDDEFFGRLLPEAGLCNDLFDVVASSFKLGGFLVRAVPELYSKRK